MKTYDIAFIICTLAGLSVLSWDKTAVEAVISGVTIGAYITWRIARK